MDAPNLKHKCKGAQHEADNQSEAQDDQLQSKKATWISTIIKDQETDASYRHETERAASPQNGLEYRYTHRFTPLAISCIYRFHKLNRIPCVQSQQQHDYAKQIHLSSAQ
jgi:hypothetical protein